MGTCHLPMHSRHEYRRQAPKLRNAKNAPTRCVHVSIGKKKTPAESPGKTETPSEPRQLSTEKPWQQHQSAAQTCKCVDVEAAVESAAQPCPTQP